MTSNIADITTAVTEVYNLVDPHIDLQAKFSLYIVEPKKISTILGSLTAKNISYSIHYRRPPRYKSSTVYQILYNPEEDILMDWEETPINMNDIRTKFSCTIKGRWFCYS